jgi:hypothetical protein
MLHCVGFAFLFADLTCSPVGGQALAHAAYCSVAQPVRVSRKDTPGTVRQAVREYAKWKSLCKERTAQ